PSPACGSGGRGVRVFEPVEGSVVIWDSPPREVEELRELLDDLLVTALLESLADAAVQMSGQQEAFELVDRALDRVGLLQDVDAILVFLDHPADALEMS